MFMISTTACWINLESGKVSLQVLSTGSEFPLLHFQSVTFQQPYSKFRGFIPKSKKTRKGNEE